MAGNNEIDSVLYKGTISFTNMSGVDIGSLESHVNSAYALTHVAVHKSHYWCHYALTKDSQRVNALMVVSVDFRSPKTEYSSKQLEQYIKDLQKEHSGKAWVHLNTRQFMAPASQGLATRVPVFVHRNEQGEIDAIQMEFNRKADEELAEAVENA